MSNFTNLTTASTTIFNGTVFTPPLFNQTILVSANASGFITEPELEESMLTDKERLLMTCIMLLLPTVCAVILAFGIRKLIKREPDDGYLDMNFSLCTKKHSIDAEGNQTLQPKEFKTSDTQFSEIPSTEELEEVVAFRDECRGAGINGGVASKLNSNSTDLSSKSTATANGSIITMTMKNNHLIVETQEPEGGVDGPLFVGTEYMAVELEGDQRALVHQDGDRCSPNEYKNTTQQQMCELQRSSTNTGMSQSDLSSSSVGSICHPYDYGNQSEYFVYDSSGALKTHFPRSESTISRRLMQEDETEEDSEDNYLKLQQKLGNSSQQQRSNDVAATTAASYVQAGGSQSRPIAVKSDVQSKTRAADPILLKTSTLPTTSKVQYHNIYNAKTTVDQTNVVS